MIELWQRQRGGLAGPGLLPEAGGPLDQAACTMASLGIVEQAVAALRPKAKNPEG